MASDYYIYYRIDEAHAERARVAVDELQRELLRRTGVQGRLMRRRDDPGTWMEIYEDVRDDDAFRSALAESIDRQGFAGVLAKGSQRVTETFVAF